MNMDLNQIMTTWGPFSAALITGIIAVVVVYFQTNAIIKAANTQSNAMIKVMIGNNATQTQLKKIELIQNALTDFLTQFYLLERYADRFNQNPEPIFNAIAKLQSALGTDDRDFKVRTLINRLSDDYILRGDISQTGSLRKDIEKGTNKILILLADKQIIN